MSQLHPHPAVFFDHVVYKIGQNIILKNITFDIAHGNITGILGPNGAGKSSLLSLINGLHPHSEGKIVLLGERLPVRNMNLRQRIGVVLQETALYEELTTFENLQFSASLYNVSNPVSRIIEVLELLKLEDRSDQIVKTLSGGLRRRIAIARALLHDPELLIIDEPTLGVDVEARHAIWQYLRLLKSKGRTTIIATNYLDEAQALCDNVAVLKSGTLLAFESPAKLIARAGFCIDIECNEQTRNQITLDVSKEEGLIKIDPNSTGLTIFMKSSSSEKHIMTTLLKKNSISGFRVRSPDLAEVFKIFEKKI